MKTMSRVGMAVLAVLVAFTSGCERHDKKKEVFYLVGVNMALPYWQTGAKGFNLAASQYKVTGSWDDPKITVLAKQTLKAKKATTKPGAEASPDGAPEPKSG